MYIGDSRRAGGPGILPLQHSLYEDHGWRLDGRSCVLAARVIDRLDHEGQGGHYVLDDGSVGDLVGAFLWRAESDDRRPCPSWSWIYPVKLGDGRISSGTPSDRVNPAYTRIPQVDTTNTSARVTPPGAPAVTPPGGGGGGFLANTYDAASGGWVLGSLDPVNAQVFVGGQMQTAAQLIKTGEKIQAAVQAQQQKKGGIVAGGGGGGFVGTWPLIGKWKNVFPGAGNVVGTNPETGEKVGIPNFFGINVEPLYPAFVGGAWDPETGQAVGALPQGLFGIGKEFLYPTWVFPQDPGGNPVHTKRKNTSKKEDDVAAWMSVDMDKALPPEEMLPIFDDQWGYDTRYKTMIAPPPPYWPAFPKGLVGITVQNTDQNKQSIGFHPTDPRLIAVNKFPDPRYGTIVADMGPKKEIATDRTARLQSMMWVVKEPKAGVFNGRKDPVLDANENSWLSWNIGPTGQGGGYGGLVTDVSPTGKEASRTGRVHGWASARHGGPFHVGEYGDKHQVGEDADGNPINSLHLSTMAYWIRNGENGGGDEDGPMLFEYVFRGGGDLDDPIAVHLAMNKTSGYWQWWTTTTIPTVPTRITERPVTTPGSNPPPDQPPGPDPTTPGGSKDPRGDSRRRGPIDQQVYNTSAPIQGRSFNASRKELASPVFSFRPQLMRNGEVDLRFSLRTSDPAKRWQDETAPITLRMEGYGRQGGTQGGPYFGGSNNWLYNQDPKTSVYRGGTTFGGVCLLPPELEMSRIDTDFVVPGISPSESYFMAGPGVSFGTGLPELSTGGLKDGFSWTGDGVDLAFYKHGPAGATSEFMRLTYGPELVMSAPINMNIIHNIINLADPINLQDAATKAYVGNNIITTLAELDDTSLINPTVKDLLEWDGSNWITSDPKTEVTAYQAKTIPSGLLSSRPVGENGELYHATDENEIYAFLA